MRCTNKKCGKEFLPPQTPKTMSWLKLHWNYGEYRFDIDEAEEVTVEVTYNPQPDGGLEVVSEGHKRFLARMLKYPQLLGTVVYNRDVLLGYRGVFPPAPREKRDAVIRVVSVKPDRPVLITPNTRLTVLFQDGYTVTV